MRLQNNDIVAYASYDVEKPNIVMSIINNCCGDDVEVVCGRRHHDNIKVYIKKSRIIKVITKEKNPEYFL